MPRRWRRRYARKGRKAVALSSGRVQTKRSARDVHGCRNGIRPARYSGEQRGGRCFFAAKFEELTDEQWDRIMDGNLKSQFLCAQAATPIMKKHGRGRIINISSLGGLLAWPSYTHYCVSKAGVIMLTRCLARALGPEILVNSVAPGTIQFPGEAPDQDYIHARAATPHGNRRRHCRCGGSIWPRLDFVPRAIVRRGWRPPAGVEPAPGKARCAPVRFCCAFCRAPGAWRANRRRTAQAKIQRSKNRRRKAPNCTNLHEMRPWRAQNCSILTVHFHAQGSHPSSQPFGEAAKLNGVSCTNFRSP